MADQLDFPGLVEDMKGKDSTEGWDVLVSYTQDKVNELLRARSVALSSILELKDIETKYVDPATNEERKVTFTMKLDHPRLQFEDTYGNVTLKFGVKEGHWIAEGAKKKQVMPQGLELLVKAILVNVSGSVGSNPNSKQSESDQKSKPPNYTIVLNPDQNGLSQDVCIDFGKPYVTVNSTNTGAIKTAEALNPIIKHTLEEYFSHAAGIKYKLSGVSNKYNEREGAHVLRPVSFCFTIMKGKDSAEAKAALCMWIGVKGGPKNGQMQTGNSSLIFRPNSRIQIPFPKGTTASLIVSKYILENHFVKPNLRKGFNELTRTSNDGQAGLKYTGKLKADDVDIDEVDEKGSGGSGPTSFDWSKHMDGINFSPSSPLTAIEITGDINGKTHSVSYTSNEQKARWDSYQRPGLASQTGESGTTNLRFTWTAKGSWKDTSDKNHPNMLGLYWTMDAHWKVNTSGQSRSFNNSFCGGPENTVPLHFKNLKVPSPNVDLRMDSLDYFLATNLLYPGAHIFKADSPAAETTAKGLAVPQDLILTGQLKTE